MPIVVEALPKEEFKRWLAARKPAPAEAAPPAPAAQPAAGTEAPAPTVAPAPASTGT
jgi:cytochrome c oxidase subunit 2